MPLLINAVSKITHNGIITTNPNKDVLYKNLVRDKKIIQKSQVVLPRINRINIRLSNMTTEQKRKYLLLKYVRQYT